MDENPHIYEKGALEDLLKCFDSEATLTPEAESILQNVALSFINSVAKEATNECKRDGKTSIDAKNIHNVLSSNYDFLLPGDVSVSNSEEIPNFSPSEDYIEKQKAIRKFISTHNDE